MKIHHLLIAALLFASPLPGQDHEEPPPGKVSAKIYSHFNWSLDSGNPSTAFEVKRAYFGYARTMSKHFSAEVKLDIGSPDDVSEYSLIRRYTYFKNAYLSYETGNIKTWFGLFDMLQFKVQEKFWGYRYLYRSYMDEYSFGPSADLGAGIQYSPSELLSADLIFSNGEGYKNLQFDYAYKVGAGITLNPLDNLTVRAYYTIHARKEAPQMTISGFVGYRSKKWRIGGEYNLQRNYKFNQDHNRYGYSAYTTFVFSEKWELFARYDQLYSNILPEQEVPWNLAKDGSAIIAGIQFTPIRYVHIALNYQDWVEYAQNGGSEPYLYLNFEIVF
jgi:opacity protein-like surface antigen